MTLIIDIAIEREENVIVHLGNWLLNEETFLGCFRAHTKNLSEWMLGDYRLREIFCLECQRGMVIPNNWFLVTR